MAKKSTPESEGVIAVPPEMQLPSFMADQPREGIDELKNFIRPPRIKVVQPTSGEDFSDKFEPGEVVSLPTFTKIVSMEDKKTGTPFLIVPIFFWPEWVTVNPREQKDLPRIAERSHDPRSIIAVKSRDAKTRTEDVGLSCGKPVSHEEHLNFIVCLYGLEGHPLNLEPMILSFSRGEHNVGTNFAALIKMRKASIYGNVFQAHSAYRSNDDGVWYGIEVDNPAGPAYVQDETLYNKFKELHNELKEAHAENRIVNDLEQGTTSGDPDPTTESEF